MAAQVGLTVVKRFPYRGDSTEEFSNTYHLTGSVPADATAWRALFDALVTQEKTLYDSSVSVVRGYGYDSDAEDAVAVWSVDLTVSPNTPVAGTFGFARVVMPGDTAVWVRWKTSRLNSNGKPIFLRKYFHPGYTATSPATPDTVHPSLVTALTAFGAKLDDGSFLDARKITARAHTDTIVSHGASAFLTTRTLKRRGRRPPS